MSRSGPNVSAAKLLINHGSFISQACMCVSVCVGVCAPACVFSLSLSLSFSSFSALVDLMFATSSSSILPLRHLAVSLWQNLPEEVGWCLPPSACLLFLQYSFGLVWSNACRLPCASFFISLCCSLALFSSWPAWVDCTSTCFSSFFHLYFLLHCSTFFCLCLFPPFAPPPPSPPPPLPSAPTLF